MKNIHIVCCLIGLCAFSFAMWESIGPYGGYLRAIGVAPGNEDIIYASAYSNPSPIVKTTNGGASWNRVTSINSYIFSMTVDPNDPDIVYAGGYMQVYKSTDGGSSWSNHSVSNYYIYGLAVHPTSPSTVFAAGRVYTGSVYVMAFFKSTNSGSSWTSVWLSDSNGVSYAMAVDPSNPNNIYVSGYYYANSSYHPAVYKSTNGGTSFTEISTGISSAGYYVYSLAVHPTISNTIYAGTYYGGIYRTTNGGSSWSLVSPSSYRYIFNMSTTIARPNYVYASADTCIYRSTNSGSNWSVLNSGLIGAYNYGIHARSDMVSRVYASNNSGFYISTNAGANWTASNQGITVNGITGFSSPHTSPSIIYTSFEDVGVFKTTNSGSDWNILPTPLTCGDICAFAFNNSNPNTLYALEGLG
jgi:photosystem II stability/assembly factor-like uncharacterized protein